MQICRLGPERIKAALELVWEVFEEFEAPDYEEMGVKTFRHFIEPSSIIEKVNAGQMKFWGCYQNNGLVGVGAIREGQHISLLFVRKQFHHLGVATMLVNALIADIASDNPSNPVVTVNSSPYAVGFYQAVGFEAIDVEQRKDGIRFTPMRRPIKV
ncbi:MAG: GNAT family N-acetyltransferase [Eubacterium sp.]|nr:GNAT family N-acetyltransferase [Eubacterium sp.]